LPLFAWPLPALDAGPAFAAYTGNAPYVQRVITLHMTHGSGLSNEGEDPYDHNEADTFPKLQLVLIDEEWAAKRAAPVLDALRYFDISVCATYFDGAQLTFPRGLVPLDAAASELPRHGASTILGRWKDLAVPTWRAAKSIAGLPMAAQVKLSLETIADKLCDFGGGEDDGEGGGEGGGALDTSDERVKELLETLEAVLKRRVDKYRARGFTVAMAPAEVAALLARAKAHDADPLGAGRLAGV
jgi:hypothetical protein